jgi:hypothetical protein
LFDLLKEKKTQILYFYVTRRPAHSGPLFEQVQRNGLTINVELKASIQPTENDELNRLTRQDGPILPSYSKEPKATCIPI